MATTATCDHQSMLDMKPACERCEAALPLDAADAMICSFECTFCRDCATGARAKSKASGDLGCDTSCDADVSGCST